MDYSWGGEVLKEIWGGFRSGSSSIEVLNLMSCRFLNASNHPVVNLNPTEVEEHTFESSSALAFKAGPETMRLHCC